jgi:hypothetical protein
MSEHIEEKRPPPPQLDLVTQLQDQILGIASLFYNFTGALQRDASPAQVNAEPLQASTSGSDTPSQIQLMAAQIVQVVGHFVSCHLRRPACLEQKRAVQPPDAPRRSDY